MIRTIAIVVAQLVLGGLATSQTVSTRHFTRYWENWPTSGICSRFDWGVPESGTPGYSLLVVRRQSYVTTFAPSQVTLPIAQPGDLDCTADHAEVFVVGDNKLISLRCDPSTGVFSTAWTHQGATAASFLGVAFTKVTSRLYLFDSRGYIYWTPYSPGTMTPPTTWSTLVSPGNIPGAAQAILSDYEIRLAGDDAARVEICLASHEYAEEVDQIVVEHFMAPPGTMNVSLVRGSRKGSATIVDPQLEPGQTSVRVSGLAGETASIVRLEPGGSVVVVGMKALVGTPETLVEDDIPTQPLELGAIYGAKSTASPKIWGPFSTPHLRFSSTDDLPYSCKFVPPEDHSASPHPDGSISPFLEVELAAPLTTVVTYPALLGIAVDDPNNRPIDFSGPNPILVPAATFEYTLTLDPADGERSGIYEPVLALPNDPSLAGVVFLFQWAVVANGTYRLSDVVGVIVRDTEWYPDNPLDGSGAAAATATARPGAVSQVFGPAVTSRVLEYIKTQQKTYENMRILTTEDQAILVKFIKDSRDILRK